MRRSSWPARLLAGILLALPCRAQPQAEHLPPVVTPAEVRRDADGDTVPDGVGQAFTVGGRASLPARPGESHFNTALQSGRAGLVLVGDSVAAPVQPGDSLVVTGTLEFRRGQALLRVASYRIVPGPRRPPTPMRLRFDQTLEPFEGMLVSFEATAVAQRRVPVGTTLTLADRDSLLYVLAFGDAGPRLFGHVHSGERVRVTGVLGQHDTAAPYLQGYQLYPASREDIRVVGRGVAFYRLVALVVAGLLVLALGLIAFLQARSRRRLARQLQSEHRYRLLFEHTDDAVFLHQIVGEGVKGLRRIACNPAAEQLFGVTQAEWIKRGADVRLVDPEAAHAMAEKVRREGRVKTRLPLRHPDGTEMVFEADAFIVREAGRPLLLSLLTNITQREAYERALVEARERAESYARLQKAFVANVSHEIRTPLTGIIGFADVLREELDGEHRQFAEMIESGGRRLLETLDAILEMARLEAQGQSLPLRSTDLAAVLRETTGTLDAVARRKQVALEVIAPEGLVTLSDANAFARIVSNLVGNALKFTPTGGTVTVTLCAGDGETVTLVVRDTGIGMSEAFQAELFEPFTQEPGSDRSHGGSGLGLAITQRLVELLGGTIGVESRKGSGTTFTVRLPLQVEVSVTAPSAEAV